MCSSLRKCLNIFWILFHFKYNFHLSFSKTKYLFTFSRAEIFLAEGLNPLNTRRRPWRRETFYDFANWHSRRVYTFFTFSPFGARTISNKKFLENRHTKIFKLSLSTRERNFLTLFLFFDCLQFFTRASRFQLVTSTADKHRLSLSLIYLSLREKIKKFHEDYAQRNFLVFYENLFHNFPCIVRISYVK